MEKVSRPKGLIRYASLDTIEGKPHRRILQRPRVLIYLGIITLVFTGIVYGLTHLGVLKMQIIHARQPLYVLLSDGTIQNRYDIKVLNKTPNDMYVTLSATGVPGQQLVGAEAPLLARRSGITAITVYVRVPRDKLPSEPTPVEFKLQSVENSEDTAEYKSVFVPPRY